MLSESAVGKPLSHAEERALQRLAKMPNLRHLLQMIRENKALFVCWGHGERPIYDLRCEGKTIRVVANKELTQVITILPDEFRSEKFHRQEKQRRRNYFRGTRNRDLDEIGE
jgi:hypothetical protein